MPLRVQFFAVPLAGHTTRVGGAYQMNEVERLLGRDGDKLRGLGLAVRAGWWTFLIGWLVVIYAWLMGLVVFKAEPAWVAALWGGVSFAEIKPLWMRMLMFLKLALLGAFLVLIWATLWLRALRREHSGR